MESSYKLFGHPIHPILVAFPIGLLSTGVLFDILYVIFGIDGFPVASFWMITAGTLGGLMAAVIGLLDWLTIPQNTRARKIGVWHGLGNASIVILFAIAWFIRLGAPDYNPETLPFILELIGAGTILITSWMGGELVYRLGMAVDDGANLDAPSSLTGSASSFGTGKYNK